MANNNNSNNNSPRRRNIQGPHSALTDFLAANNISAAEIRATYEARRRQQEAASGSATPSAAATATATASTDNASTGNGTPHSQSNEDKSESENSSSISPKRRRAELTAAIKRKRQMRKLGLDDDDLPARDDSGRRPNLPVPGKFVNCGKCGARFMMNTNTLTITRRALGDDALCAVCAGRQSSDAQGQAHARMKQETERIKRGRRQIASNMMDGVGLHGALSLLETCVKYVADQIHDIEEFGDMPEWVRLRLGQILSKRRAIDARTLQLFLRGEYSSIDIYDCAGLNSSDFRQIFISMPNLRHLNLRFAGQLKNEDVELLINRDLQLEELQLDACNLVSSEMFKRLFEKYGPTLTSVKLSNLDCSLDDDALKTMAAHCRKLQRLKLQDCWLLGDGAVQAIGELAELRHLSLSLEREADAEILVSTISKVGAKLETLSLRGFGKADDRLLSAIREKCTRLSKLRFTDNSVCTDKGYAALFSGWSGSALSQADLSRTRDMDNTNPLGPQGEEAVGLASEGFKALMGHSGSKLQRLNISACRHISRASFAEVFDSSKGKRYEQLRELDMSFLTVVDDELLQGVMESCPRLQKVVAFACFNVREAAIRRGVSYFGGLNAHNYVLESGRQG